MAPIARRQAAWARLASDLAPTVIDDMAEEIPLEGAIEGAKKLMAGEVAGRLLVRMA